MAIKYFSIISFLFFFAACSKKATLDENYWEARESGAYKFTNAKASIYKNGLLEADSNITIGNAYLLLHTTAVGGFNKELSLYGTWEPPFFENYKSEKAWNMENDDKRITFLAIDPTGEFVPTATLTIDHIGEKIQQWHYIISSGNKSIHYTYTMEHTNQP